MRFSKLLAFAVVAAALSIAGSAVGAEEGDTLIEIPVSEVYVTGEVGSSVAMGEASVDADLVGRSCTVTATVTNGASVHPGNTLVVSSNDSQVVIAGIEDSADSVTVQGGTITLGNTVTASVVLGPDGATSLGSSLTVTCEALPATEPGGSVVEEPTYTG